LKVLIIEDSVSLRRSLRVGLSNLGFTVDDTGDGSEGLSMALSGDYSLLILDLMLPSVDGTSILKAIRQAGKDIRVLILSAKDLTEDKVDGLLGVGTTSSLGLLDRDDGIDSGFQLIDPRPQIDASDHRQGAAQAE